MFDDLRFLKRGMFLAECHDMQQHAWSVVEFVEAYDRFREEAALSDDKELQILQILADAQNHFMERDPMESFPILALPRSQIARGPGNTSTFGETPVMTMTIMKATERLRALMTPLERAAWERHMEPIAPFSRLCYGEPQALAFSGD
jgi:hypothetical protein